MFRQSLTLATILALAGTAFGTQDSSFQRPSGSTVSPKAMPSAAVRTKSTTAYFPAKGKDSAKGAATGDLQPLAEATPETRVTPASRLKPSKPSAAAKLPVASVSPTKPAGSASRAVHTETPGRKTNVIAPAAFADREEEDFEAYLEDSVPQERPAERPRVTAGRTMSRPLRTLVPAVDGQSSMGGSELPIAVRPKTAGAAVPVLPAEAPEGSQTPTVSMEWVSRGEFQAGRETVLELRIRNCGRSTVAGVTAEVVAPVTCDFSEIAPEPDSRSERMTWSLGELKPAETRSIVFHFTPQQPGDVRMTAAVQLTGTAGFSFSVLEPKLELAIDGPETAEVGQSAGFLMRVSNPGTGTAENVVIRAKIPGGLEHKSGDTLQIDVGTLNPGESRQAQLNLSAQRGGTFEIEVRAEAEGGLMQTATAEFSVSEPNLLVAIEGPAQEMTGHSSDYRLQISNSGKVPSVNVRARYRVPEGFEFVSANRGGRFSQKDASVEWFVGTLRPEETSAFQVSLKAIRTGNVTHQAGVVSEHGKVTMCEHSTSVRGIAVLELQVVGAEERLSAGKDCVRRIRISNSGSEVARAVGVSCELPSSLELADVSGPSEYIAENGVLVFRSLPEIAAGSTEVYELRLKCLRPGNHRLRLRVASPSISEPLIGEETISVSE